jgi:hypothetical protein
MVAGEFSRLTAGVETSSIVLPRLAMSKGLHRASPQCIRHTPCAAGKKRHADHAAHARYPVPDTFVAKPQAAIATGGWFDMAAGRNRPHPRAIAYKSTKA